MSCQASLRIVDLPVANRQLEIEIDEPAFEFTEESENSDALF